MNNRFPKIDSTVIGIILSTIILVSSCGKTEEVLSPEQKVLRYLTGQGNRFWQLKEIYVNGTRTSLTMSQQSYNKTYTSYAGNAPYTGFFGDSDGNDGRWGLKGADHLMDTITNSISGLVIFDLTINSIDAYNMDVQYTKNGQTIRSVYSGN